MNLFEQYGIKEVADVTIYSIHKKTDGSGDVYYMPALYLDTLKVSTVEKAGESTWALGGLGNARLINWDYGKTINVTLEDALCTPASLGLCWNGVLGADWKDAHVEYESEVCVCRNPLTRLSRMEKAIYPSGDRKTVSRLLPQTPSDSKSIDDLELLRISSIVDGTKVNGIGMVGSKTYNWKMAIESAVKSIAVVPDRFFDVNGRAYSIDWNRKISADSLPTYLNYKSAVIYRINTTSNFVVPPIAEIIFDNEMQNRCGKELAVKIKIDTESETTMYHKKAIISKEIYNNLSNTDKANYDVIYKLYELNGSHVGYKTTLTLEEYNTYVEDSEVKDYYVGVESTAEYEFSGTDSEITATEYNNLSDELKATYEPTSVVTTTGEFNIYNWLADNNYLFEKGVIVGAQDGDYITPVSTVSELVPEEVHFVLCPKDRTITILPDTTEIDLRVFTLNAYGIEKYLNGDAGNLVHDLDALKALTKFLQNHATTNMFDFTGRPVDEDDDVQTNVKYIEDKYNSIETITAIEDLSKGDYLAIIVDANNNYHALIGITDGTSISDSTATKEDIQAQLSVKWYKPSVDVNVTQFEGIDMWLRFESVNEMIYFLITKYEQDILEIRSALICPKDETSDGNWDVNRNRTALHMSTAKEDKKEEGALWAYINPRTMQPYSDDYWFHQGDPFYVKSLTLAQDGKRIKGNQITVKADEWPGVYMVVGETRIRNRDTGEDERMLIKFPQCKVKADLTLTLSADGDPTTFTINLEIAKPRNGHMMELTAYEVANRMTEGENGCYYAIDGTSKVVTE